jgi:hypothetical protein
VHRKYIQKDATLHSLFISGKFSTCFGWYFHPSSGAHTTVSTASGICHNTVTAICRCAPDDGWKYHPKHVEQFPDINELCNVASCWMYEYTGILLGARPVLHISRLKVNTSMFISVFYMFRPTVCPSSATLHTIQSTTQCDKYQVSHRQLFLLMMGT